jgi:hypothetical protein
MHILTDRDEGIFPPPITPPCRDLCSYEMHIADMQRFSEGWELPGSIVSFGCEEYTVEGGEQPLIGDVLIDEEALQRSSVSTICKGEIPAVPVPYRALQRIDRDRRGGDARQLPDRDRLTLGSMPTEGDERREREP